jgi:hypothetical protein
MPPAPQPPSSYNVLARYGNFFQGDDDLFAHALILRNGHCIRLFQGLAVVTATYDRVPDAEHDQLVRLLADANEIAVFGVQAGGAGPPGEYFVADPTSQIGSLVKSIAAVD